MDKSNFQINKEVVEWPEETRGLRRALVCSLGIGGTNAYVALQAYDEERLRKQKNRLPAYNLLASGRTLNAADEAMKALLKFISKESEIDIGDVGYTSQVGRFHHSNRQVAIAIPGNAPETLKANCDFSNRKPKVCFMFSGQGKKFSPANVELLQENESLNAIFTKCVRYFAKVHSINVLSAFETENTGSQPIDTQTVQAALFCFEYALAKLLIEWGVNPSVLIGHSVGELIALCVGGILSLPEAMDTIALRGLLMSGAAEGRMVAAMLTIEELEKYEQKDLSIAARNSPNETVVSGAPKAVADFEEQLRSDRVQFHRLHTSFGFHSHLMSPQGEAFASHAKTLTFRDGHIPVISTVLPGVITGEILHSEKYWNRSIVGSVEFQEAVERVNVAEPTLFLEVGPSNILTNLIWSLVDNGIIERSSVGVSLFNRSSSFDICDVNRVTGWSWIYNSNINRKLVFGGVEFKRERIPTYPFQRKKYQIVTNSSIVNDSNQNQHCSVRQSAASFGADVSEHNIEQEFARILGFNLENYKSSIFELGGDSLICISLLRGLRQRFNIEITMGDLLKDPSVDGVTEFLSKTLQRSNVAQMKLDYREITHLPDDISLQMSKNTDPLYPKILLTGATGFIGTHLLAALLERTAYPIVCLVRSVGNSNVKSRLEDSLKKYKVWKDTFSDRFYEIECDLALPRLGLSETVWFELASDVVAIFHAGAAVNHIYPAELLTDVNVSSNVELLRLCMIGAKKRIFFTSSVAVFSSPSYSVGDLICETWELQSYPDSMAGYAFSKAAGEQLLLQASKRGFSVFVFRLPNVTGHSHFGICNTKDGLWALVKTLVSIKAVPSSLELEKHFSVLCVPVEQIVDAMVRSFSEVTLESGCFNCFPELSINLLELVESLKRVGFTINRIADAEWEQRVKRIIQEDSTAETYLWILGNEFRIPLSPARSYSSSKLVDLISDCKFEKPNAETIDNYMCGLIKLGFLPDTRI